MREYVLPTENDSSLYMRYLGRIVAAVGVTSLAVLAHHLYSLA